MGRIDAVLSEEVTYVFDIQKCVGMKAVLVHSPRVCKERRFAQSRAIASFPGTSFTLPLFTSS